MRRILPLLLAACAPVPPADDLPDDTDTDDTDVVDTDTDGSDTDVLPAACPPGAGPTIAASTGCVLGQTAGEVESFLGIPYAEPPVGDLRWRRPVPIAPWTEPLDAAALGPPCPQSTGTLDGDLDAGEGAEDCLTLNVLRPTGASGLPILFFTHGGGHTDGSGGQDLYLDDPELASKAVVVTHNYRLGPLGFLAHPALSGEDPDGVSGNQGLRDTMLALAWVHENAAALGGDPSRIVVFGESAGGLSSCALWAAPSTLGQIAAVVTQSAPCSAVRRPYDGRSTLFVETGLDQGLRFVTAARCEGAPDELACLRALSTDEVLAAMPARQGTLGEGEAYGIVIDRVLLPRTFDDALADGDLPLLPFVATANADEGTLLAAGIPVPDEAAYRALLAPYALVVRQTVDTLIDAWPASAHGGSHAAAFQAFYGDFAFVCGTRRLLSDVEDAGYPARGLFFARGRSVAPALGAYHGAELPYVFGTLTLTDAVDEALSDALQSTWAALGTGSLQVPEVGPWPRVGDGWLHADAEGALGTLADVRPERCDLLDP